MQIKKNIMRNADIVLLSNIFLFDNTDAYTNTHMECYKTMTFHVLLIFVTMKCEKRLLLRCIHNFISDLIYNMDHMRISGIEPSSVILSQTK